MLLCRRAILLHKGVREVGFPHVLPFIYLAYHCTPYRGIAQAVFLFRPYFMGTRSKSRRLGLRDRSLSQGAVAVPAGLVKDGSPSTAALAASGSLATTIRTVLPLMLR